MAFFRDSWYYIKDGQVQGPHSECKMQDLVEENVITEDTPVWGGFGDHRIPLKYTILRDKY